MKYLLVIAIEEYNDPLLRRVAWALNDANALITTFERHGYANAGRYVHLNKDASKTAIESRLRRLKKQLTADDELVVYYAGHGFAANGVNVLTAWDTQFRDLEHTSLPLATLLEALRQSECRRVKLFLDACHTGVVTDTAMRGVHTTLSNEELEDFFDSDHCVAFASCQTDEESYSSGVLKHGIWTYHLLEALEGNAPSAIVAGNLVTSNSLQNYLRQAVPQTVRKTFTDDRPQNPWMFGGSGGEFAVVDLGPILAARVAKPAPAHRLLPRATFLVETRHSIRSLGGFQRFHTVPKAVDNRTRSFVRDIGSGEVGAEITSAYKKIRDGMGYKKNELSEEYEEGAEGTIITPHFDYNASIQQSETDAGEAVLRREITHVRDVAAMMSDDVQATFPRTFDTLELENSTKINVSRLIDHLEETVPEDVEIIDYDDEGTFCKLAIEGLAGNVFVTEYTLRFVSESFCPPRVLANSIALAWAILQQAGPVGMLPEPNPQPPTRLLE